MTFETLTSFLWWDVVIAISLIISSLIGLVLFFLRQKKKNRSEQSGQAICIVNSLTDQPIANCKAVFLRDGAIVSHVQSPNGILESFKSVESDTLHFSASGFLSERRDIQKLGNTVKLAPHLSSWQHSGLYHLFRYLEVIEIVLLVIGTILIPFFASNETLIVFLLADLSLWLLLLKRISRPQLKIQVVNRLTGQPVCHALIAFHHTDHTVLRAADREGKGSILLPLPKTFSIVCSGYRPIQSELLPATAISDSTISIPLQPLR